MIYTRKQLQTALQNKLPVAETLLNNHLADFTTVISRAIENIFINKIAEDEDTEVIRQAWMDSHLGEGFKFHE